jgi:hypothetical protein
LVNCVAAHAAPRAVRVASTAADSTSATTPKISPPMRTSPQKPSTTRPTRAPPQITASHHPQPLCAGVVVAALAAPGAMTATAKATAVVLTYVAIPCSFRLLTEGSKAMVEARSKAVSDRYTVAVVTRETGRVRFDPTWT